MVTGVPVSSKKAEDIVAEPVPEKEKPLNQTVDLMLFSL